MAAGREVAAGHHEVETDDGRKKESVKESKVKINATTFNSEHCL